MTEDEAKAWVLEQYGSDIVGRLDEFGARVVQETTVQNLIAPATVGQIWSRHLVDSAQLLRFAPDHLSSWIDVGTGAGFPGMVAAIMLDCPVHLIEPRARRADFLRRAADEAGLRNVQVHQNKVDAVTLPAATVISARAVTALDALLAMTNHLSDAGTRYILPRGRGGVTELKQIELRWKGMFHVEQSLTDPSSSIILADGVIR